MKRLFTILISLHLSVIICSAQPATGARLKAMGNQNAAVKDIWNFAGNFNYNGQNNRPTIAINFQKFFYGNELSNQSLKFVQPLNNYEFGLSFQRYGITEYNEITTGASVAKNFGGKFSIGLKANYHQLKIENYGTTNGFSVDVALKYLINKNLIIGANIYNPSKQSYNNNNISINIPNIINIGFAYQASNKILIATTFSKNFNVKIDVGLGLEYQLIELISLRGGITTQPFKQYGGLGIDYKNIKLDLAIENDRYLGYSSQIGLAYAF